MTLECGGKETGMWWEGTQVTYSIYWQEVDNGITMDLEWDSIIQKARVLYLANSREY
jgi:hypothetical protein